MRRRKKIRKRVLLKIPRIASRIKFFEDLKRKASTSKRETKLKAKQRVSNVKSSLSLALMKGILEMKFNVKFKNFLKTFKEL